MNMMQRIDKTLVIENLSYPPPKRRKPTCTKPKSELRLRIEAMQVWEGFSVNTSPERLSRFAFFVRKELKDGRKYAIRKMDNGRAGIWRIA